MGRVRSPQGCEPRHVNDIISNRAGLASACATPRWLANVASRKKGKIFERTGPNWFGLREWHAEREAEELFGREQLDGLIVTTRQRKHLGGIPLAAYWFATVDVAHGRATTW